MDLKLASEKRFLKLNELEELRFIAYESSRLYKEQSKKRHDAHIKDRDFKVGDKVFLFNSHLRLFPGKLKSRLSGPFVIANTTPYGSFELEVDGRRFMVNGQRIKKYFDKRFIGKLGCLRVTPESSSASF